MKKATVAIITALLGALLLSGAAMAQYPPGGATASVSDTTVVPGQTITVSGNGWLPGSTVTITFFSQPEVLGTAQVNSQGEFSTTVTIPGDASPGRHTLRVSGTGANGQPRVVDIPITVVGAAAAGEGPLAVTGDNIKVGLLLLAGLLAAGTAVLLMGRRRGRVDS